MRHNREKFGALLKSIIGNFKSIIGSGLANIDSIDGWGVLLVDAFNAFNSLNCISVLLHARVLWPRCYCFLFNTYRGWSVLVLRGSSDFLYSKEGVT